MAADSVHTASLRDILLVEDDEDIALAVRAVLDDEGYTLHIAPTLDEAHALAEQHLFRLILADVFPGESNDLLAPVDALRERAFPTPVALVTARRFETDEVRRRGFCALITKPFDLDFLLMTVAACLDQPIEPEHQGQVETVRRYFAALSTKDWDALGTLCDENVIYVLPGTSTFAQEVVGKAAFLAFSAATFEQFAAAHFGDVVIYELPHGLAARYTGTWRMPDGSEAHQSGAVVFHFTGDRIARIGVQLNEQRLEALTRGR